MSELLQFIIVVGFGAICFGCGFLTSFIVTRKRWRGEMIERGIAQYNSQTGVCEMIERGVTRLGAAKRAPLGANRGELRQAGGVPSHTADDGSKDDQRCYLHPERGSRRISPSCRNYCASPIGKFGFPHHKKAA